MKKQKNETKLKSAVQKIKKFFLSKSVQTIMLISGVFIYAYFIFYFLSPSMERLIWDFNVSFLGYYIVFALVATVAFGSICFLTSQLDFLPKFNKWLWIMLFLMFATFSIGTAFIAAFFGSPQSINFVLRDAENITLIDGNITCVGDNQYVLAGDTVRCNPLPHLSNMSGFVQFVFLNGTIYEENLTPDSINKSYLDFVAPSDTKRLGFYLSGRDEKGVNHGLTVMQDMRIISKEDNQIRQEKLLGFILALLAVVLFTIPSLVLNVKKIYRN